MSDPWKQKLTQMSGGSASSYSPPEMPKAGTVKRLVGGFSAPNIGRPSGSSSTSTSSRETGGEQHPQAKLLMFQLRQRTKRKILDEIRRSLGR